MVECRKPDFWEGKDPCWVVLECSKYVHSICPAYQYRDRPCWEQAVTHCRKLLALTWECKDCRVFKMFGNLET
jgi:hypothetical protein